MGINVSSLVLGAITALFVVAIIASVVVGYAFVMSLASSDQAIRLIVHL